MVKVSIIAVSDGIYSGFTDNYKVREGVITSIQPNYHSVKVTIIVVLKASTVILSISRNAEKGS